MNQRAFKCKNCGYVLHNWTTIFRCIACHSYDVIEIEWDLPK